MDRIYCADQIEVPAALPAILKSYSKEVIRYNPKDIPAFSRDYFTALAAGQIDTFLAEQAAKKRAAEAAAGPVAASGSSTAK